MTAPEKQNAGVVRQAAPQARQTSRQLDTAHPGGMALRRASEHPERASSSEILALQRCAGNRAVRGLIQARLTVGPAVDRYEQEADHVANQVINMPAQQGSSPSGIQRLGEDEVQARPLAATISRLIQREAAAAEDQSNQVLPI